MKQEYIEKFREIRSEIVRISKKILKLATGRSTLTKAKDNIVFVNYAVILAYGCIENTVKLLIADFYSQNTMSNKCKDFANKLYDNYPVSINDKFYNFLKKECCENWLNELCTRKTNKDKYSNTFTIKDLFVSNTFLCNARNAFAHGSSSYSGNVNDIITWFDRGVCWLYEIDDIIQNFPG